MTAVKRLKEIAARKGDPLSVIARAINSGGAVVIGPRHLKWNISGRCQSPIERRYEERYNRVWFTDYHAANVAYELNVRRLPWKPDGQWYKLDMSVRCRKCRECLKSRAYEWRGRAVQELSEEGRNWFVTLTLSPAWVHNLTTRGKIALNARGHPLDELDAKSYDIAALECAKEVTKYVKRLRASGYQFRFMAVEERHLSDVPHFHLLVHEKAEPIPYRVLKEGWRARLEVSPGKHEWFSLGFFHAKLASNVDVAKYVTKYLAKGGKRIRCSLRYGKSFST